jgi:hypothetical protein
MRRKEYERAASASEIQILISKAERIGEVLRDIASLADIYASVCRDAERARKSVRQGQIPLDYSEFLRALRQLDPRAAEMLDDAELLKFDLGRMHLRFTTEKEKAAFDWHRHTIEALTQKLYGTKFNVIVRQPDLAY